MAFKKSKQPVAVVAFLKADRKKKKGSALSNVPDKSYRGALTE